ncbi:sensor histidine kinase YpdA [mine drainage metagenome]|uniref:Sensor histidine kinase YpdA n=1 Tax=mine drainage metagenome TaxID=410659 RepID=A0A1J5PQL2_9ZZZZ
MGDALAQAHNALIPHVGGGPWSGTPRTFQGFLVACILTLLFAFFFNRIERHRQEAEEQRRFAEAAQEAALRSRLVPHFIFNALNTLHAQIQGDPKGAEATTERLADLFRQVLALSDDATIPLKQELAFVEAYLGIEQARLGERLKVVVEVPEDLETMLIPPLSLQVLVENAVKHGVAAREQGGEIRIFADRLGDGVVQVGVDDPGDGSSGNGSLPGTGTALDTLRQRLEKPEDLAMGLVGGRHRVSFRWRLA